MQALTSVMVMGLVTMPIRRHQQHVCMATSSGKVKQSTSVLCYDDAHGAQRHSILGDGTPRFLMPCCMMTSAHLQELLDVAAYTQVSASSQTLMRSDA